MNVNQQSLRELMDWEKFKERHRATHSYRATRWNGGATIVVQAADENEARRRINKIAKEYYSGEKYWVVVKL